jgi:competence protein ComEC
MSLSLLLAVVVSTGVAAGVFLNPAWLWLPPWIVAICGVLAFALAARGYVAPATSVVGIGFAAICALLAAGAQHRAMYPSLRVLLEQKFGGFAIDTLGLERHDTPYEIEGRLIGDATVTDAGANLRLHVDRVWLDACPEPASGGASVTVVGVLVDEAAREWRAGRVVRMPAVLRRPARYLNDGVPDQELMLARRGISLVGTVKSAALVKIVERGGWYHEWASAIRAAVRSALARHVGTRDPHSEAVAVAILIGDRGSLDPAVEQRLQEAGTYHVIAISGGNIAILAGLILATLWAAGIRGGWAAAAAVCLLGAYAHVAGGGPSVLRATLMAATYLSLRVIDQRTAPRHALALAAAIVLLSAPLSIADVGLWMTIGATAALIVGASRLPLPRRWWLKPVIALVGASICAEIALLPIVAYVFQRVTVAGLIVNLAAVPCMAIVQVAAMVTAAADTGGVESIAGLAGWITHLGVRGLIDSAVVVDAAPWLTWRVPSPALWIIVIYYGILLAIVVLGARLRALTRRVLVAAAVSLFLWIAIAPQTFSRRFGDGQLHLTMIDVGQGDSMLVTLPNGRTALVDTGGVSVRGDFDIGDRVIGPALRARGLSQLDYLVITHGDPDHIGGAASIIRDFKPAEIWYGTFVNNHEPTQTVQQIAKASRSTWRWLTRGDRFEVGSAELRVHHPPPPDWERQQVRNDDSLVVELRYGQVSILLTGDIGAEVERELIPSLELLPTVILKSPHHGSGTSSSAEFIDAVNPKVVAIGVGRANPYGHPLPYVLERYRNVGSRVLRTDRDGQFDVSTDGRDVFINAKGTKAVVRGVPGAQ